MTALLSATAIELDALRATAVDLEVIQHRLKRAGYLDLVVRCEDLVDAVKATRPSDSPSPGNDPGHTDVKEDGSE